MKKDNILIITADHGCDPTTPSTDHSREYVPLLIYGKQVKGSVDLGIETAFGDLGETIAKIFNIGRIEGEGAFWGRIKNSMILYCHD